MAKKLKDVNYYDAQNPEKLTEIGYVNGVRVEINLNQDVQVNEGIKEMFDYANKARRKLDTPPKNGKITPESEVRKF